MFPVMARCNGGGWVVAATLCAATAHADVVVQGVEMTRHQGAAHATQNNRVVFISPRGIRMDVGDISHVVDAQKQLMVELDHRRKTARVLTFAQLGEMTTSARKEADVALERAKSQLNAMPPEVRKEVEAALRAQKAAAAARQPGAYQRKPTGNKRVVNGLACEDVKEFLNGEWVGQSCVHTGVKLSAADRKMLIKLAEDMGKAGLAGAGQGEFTRAFLDGIPVEMASRDLSNGTLTVEEQVKVIELKPVPDALFEVPAGYRASAWEDEHTNPQNTPQRRGPPPGQPQPRGVPPGQPQPSQPR